MTVHRRFLPLPLALALAALTLTGGLAACGRKGAPEPPKGEEAAYTYPQAYPDPGTMVPGPDHLSTPPAPTLPGQSFGDERQRTVIIQSQ